MKDPTQHAQQQLIEDVQHNCHISDALYARDYSLCIYLLKMREYFRWERGLAYGASLPKEELGDWITQREAYWDALLEDEYRDLALGGDAVDPFQSERINAGLRDGGYIYSGGIGMFAKPSFFIAELDSARQEYGYPVYIAGRELARDINAQPAMSDGHQIILRRESLRRMLWEKLEEWGWRRQDNAMGRALAYYPFDSDVLGALDSMTEAETDAVIFHEVGELKAGEFLGQQWRELIAQSARSRLELAARAMRDHLADTWITLPNLLEREAEASIHFYFGNLSGMRKAIYPSLMRAYERWIATGKLKYLHDALGSGLDYWQGQSAMLLAHFDRYGQEGIGELEKRVGDIKL